MPQHHVPPEWREALVHVQQAEDRLATLTADITKLETEKAERERAFRCRMDGVHLRSHHLSLSPSGRH